jgi:hypothetical protein
MVEQFQAAPEHLHVKPPVISPAVILQRLEAELDELWSFVGTKTNRQWVWVAMDATTRQVIAFHVSDRSSQSAQALWEVTAQRGCVRLSCVQFDDRQQAHNVRPNAATRN